MFSTDTLLKFVLGTEGLILMSLMTLFVRYFKGERGQQLNATLETADTAITNKSAVIEDAYEKLKFAYDELKKLYLRTKTLKEDGVSLDEARSVGRDLLDIKDRVQGVIIPTSED